MNFAQIPFCVLADRSIGRIDIMIYGVLLFMQGSSTEVRTSLRRIAERLADESGHPPLDRRRVSEAIGRLEIAGLVRRVDYGRGTTTGYRVVTHRELELTAGVRGDDIDTFGDPAEGDRPTVRSAPGRSQDGGDEAGSDVLPHDRREGVRQPVADRSGPAVLHCEAGAQRSDSAPLDELLADVRRTLGIGG